MRPCRRGSGRVLLLAVLCIAGGIAVPTPAAAVQADYSRTPILMIHGYFVISNAGDATWSNFRRRLVQDGWPEEYIATPSFADVRGCNEDHVNEIEAWVEDLRKRTYADRIDIVCHSFGCLNTLTWLKERCGVNRVRQFVGLAGAVHGTWVACADDLVGLSCAGHQMCIPMGEDRWRDNELLVQVNACDETPGDTQYTTIWSDYDEIIRPPVGSQLAGARNIEVETALVEHGGIFLCDECFQHVLDALKSGGANDDGPGWDCIPGCAPPEVTDPAPEAGEEAGEAPDEAARDAVAEEADPGIAEIAADAPFPDLAGDPGVAEPPPERALETVEADVSSADDAAEDAVDAPEDVPLPVKTSSGCTAGPPGAGAGFPALLLAAWMLATGARRARRTPL